ncbi:Dynein-1-beta heavy chain, flagellar inner arm I1 complex [Symbiodinium microadriaticum]|uniref:Dynein-1-beta heavy chain, flagellar inner arm I1 complex n=1 Tax=Symbiodinium microadriaticum TaxID=2951 RepID=A0A1Q9DF31_SYMMI|nr:Dynein-1-beta heavy chain, flagellar inner arm I1 complex [Symbiodinium microadriaticum]
MAYESYNRVKEVQKYRRLFFSLCWFHAILLERKKFKMLGWNIGYDFNDSDFDICENILAMYLDETRKQIELTHENPNEIPWDAIRYLIAEANYGGRVTEHPDNRILRSGCGALYVMDARKTKVTDGANAFGQHTNAEISSSLADTDTLMQTMIEVAAPPEEVDISTVQRRIGHLSDEQIQILLHAVREHQGNSIADDSELAESAVAAGWSKGDSRDIGEENIDWEEVRDRNEADTSPLKVCLLQESERYNILLSAVRSSIKVLQKGIQGLVVISKEQEAVMNSLYQGSVPVSWLFAYPSPRGRILASDSVSVDALSFDFVVQNQEESQITALPKEGAYIKSALVRKSERSPLLEGR